MRAFHTKQGDPRTKILIPDSAHGTNPASVTLSGLPPVRRCPRDAPRAWSTSTRCSGWSTSDVAGLMLTNPNTLGLFEVDIDGDHATRPRRRRRSCTTTARTSTRSWAGSRPGDMGFDIVHMNTHKTFATPHGGGGPGAGPVAVVERLEPFLPAPIVEHDRRRRAGSRWDHDRPDSIGRVHGFNGNFGILVRAYAYVFGHGRDGLKAVGERAVLNANYLAALVDAGVPAGVPGRAADARVRLDGEAAATGTACGPWTSPSG